MPRALYRESKQTWRDIQEMRADTNGSAEKTISGISGNGEEGVRDDIRSNGKKFSRRSWYKC